MGVLDSGGFGKVTKIVAEQLAALGTAITSSGAISTTSTLAVTGATTLTGGVAASTMGRHSTIPIGAVAYGSLGTNTTPTAGTIYYAEVFLPANKTLTGIGILNGGTVGTDNGLVALANSAGTIVANSDLAGAVTAGANAFQQFAFTATYAAVGPARYWILYQVNGNTTRFRSVAVSTYLPFTGSVAGVFGTLAAITPPTSTTADVGPIAYVY